ncbi:MAG: hypothetical protein ACJ0QT_02025 [Gammaproteobacteria bacterium]
MDIKYLFKLLIQGTLGFIFLMILAWVIVFLGDVFCHLSGSADSLQACREHNNWPVIIK